MNARVPKRDVLQAFLGRQELIFPEPYTHPALLFPAFAHIICTSNKCCRLNQLGVYRALDQAIRKAAFLWASSLVNKHEGPFWTVMLPVFAKVSEISNIA